jgi:hypothetical protein
MNRFILLTTLFVLAFCNLYAQSTFTQKVTMIAMPILEMKIDDNLSTSDFTFNSLEEYKNGKTKNNALGISVVSNIDWVVNVKSSSPTFNPQTVGNTDILSSTLSINKNGSTNQIQVSTENQMVASGHFGGFDKNHFILDYTAKPGNIKHDIYSLEVVYTLSPL